MTAAIAIVFVIDKWRKKSWIFFLRILSAKINLESFSQMYRNLQAGRAKRRLDSMLGGPQPTVQTDLSLLICSATRCDSATCPGHVSCFAALNNVTSVFINRNFTLLNPILAKE